jgi:peptide chain release factor subunit 1
MVDEFMQKGDADLLIVGGHEETVPEFLPFLSHQMQPRVVGTFTIDPHTMTPGQVRQHAELVVEQYERDEERRLVESALERVAAGGLGASGLPWCLMAVDEQAIEVLLIHDDSQAPGWACDNCGWLGLSPLSRECPVCGQPIRHTPDIIDEMAAKVFDTSGRVEHVYADTPLVDHIVAANLRFPVPRP